MRRCVRRLIAGVLVAVAFLPVSGAKADVINIGFAPIINDPALNAVASQFSLEVQMVTETTFDGDPVYDPFIGMVAFTFRNVGPTTANISEVYWSWGDPSLVPSVPEILDPTPPAPGGFYIDPSGETWFLYPPDASAPPNMQGAQVGYGTDASADQGNQPGISVGQSSTFFMGLVAGADWEDVSTGLYGSLINFGMHVRSIGTYDNTPNNNEVNGDSAWFVSIRPVPPLDPGGGGVVPVPGAASLGLLGFGLIAAARRKARK